jgi:hypothetical protein
MSVSHLQGYKTANGNEASQLASEGIGFIGYSLLEAKRRRPSRMVGTMLFH